MSGSLAHRKATNRICFVDSKGNALARVQVEAKQTNHKFLFGCGAFDSLPATSDEKLDNIDFYHDPTKPSKTFFQDRVDKWLDVFNYGTIPFYWGGFEPTEGDVQTDSRMRAAKMLQSKNVKVKGHPLCWHTACADWLMEYDNATILQKQLDRINRDVSYSF